MKKTFFACLACLYAFALSAQADQLLSDPSVSWVAEAEFDIALDVPGSFDPNQTGLKSPMLLKATASDPAQLYSEPTSLGGILLAQANTPGQAVFADAALQQKLDVDGILEKLSRTDTIMVFSVETYEGEQRIIHRDLTPKDFKGFRVRQLVYYREKTAEFGLLTLAIGPVLKEGKVPFWLPVDSPAAPYPSVSDPAVTWAYRVGVQNREVLLGDLKPLKQPARPVMQMFMQRVIEDPTTDIFSAKNWAYPVRADDRANLYGKADTIVTFDPETYEEHVRITRMEVGADYLRLGLVQDWFWDDQRKRLVTRLVAACPIMHVTDEQGNYMYALPLFFRKVGK